MERFVHQTLLFDFYGLLLTDHQRAVYEDVVCNDIGCSEVAAREGVSRQSINELVRKCDRTMEGYEEKLHLVGRYLAVRDQLKMLKKRIGETASEAEAGELTAICDRILEEL